MRALTTFIIIIIIIIIFFFYWDDLDGNRTQSHYKRSRFEPACVVTVDTTCSSGGIDSSRVVALSYDPSFIFLQRVWKNC